ncbi:alpha/beta fold hydrolase [Mycolicibacterium komossense]|uniref:Alpha/beta hydrolase n=1 Tax=Mycolicibacterium komossense TaxID=1779 RepID=A0ABT3C5K6_9MYCO|nr:alpha/beta hydrolase [Mycolicibacterium komossense]MCV7224752.1 alpha/beta hydrolase [Mycolicibacterium komossense]
MQPVFSHDGQPVTHGRASINGTRIHYVTAGSGEPLVLIHGVPKSWYYWHRIIPKLSEHFTVICPDVRGFGDSFRPHNGYDMSTIADDITELVDHLGFDKFGVAGEDWGACFALAIAAKNPQRVIKLSFAESLLPGFGLEDWSHLSVENHRKGRFLWHVSFFHVPDIPESLIQGREAMFWSTWMKNETYDPAAITQDCVDEWARTSSAPGALRAIFEVYRSTWTNIDLTKRWAQERLPMPVLTIGAEHFIAEEARQQMLHFSDNVDYAELDCGHSLALERPRELERILIDFFTS